MKIKLKIEQHSLWEFLKDVQEATLKGYVLDLDTNEYFPQSYGSYYSVTLVKESIVADYSEVPVVASLEQSQAVDPDFVEVKEEPVVAPVKRTRKPKAEPESTKVDAVADAIVPE